MQNLGGSDNTAVGYEALKDHSGNDGNTAIGSKALKQSRTGAYNTAVGGRGSLWIEWRSPQCCSWL